MMRFFLRHGPILLLLTVLGAVYAATLTSYGMFGWDEAEYATLARSLLRGEGFAIGGQANHYRLPMLPAASALSMLAFGSGVDWVAKLPIIVFALAVLGVVYSAVCTVYDAMTGWFAAALLGLFPMFWLYTAHLLTAIPFMLFFSAALFSLYFSFYRDPRWLPAFAFFTALALLTRYTGVLLGPLALVYFGVYALSDREGAVGLVRRRVFVSSLFIGAFILLPWLVRQQLTFGDAITGFRYASKQLSVYRPELSMPWNYYLLRLPWMLTPAGAALAAGGALWALWKRDRFALHCVLSAAGILVWHSFYRYKEDRLVMAILPFAAVLAAVAITRLLALKSRWLRRGLAAGVIALMVGLSAHTVMPRFRFQITNGYPPFLSAMQRLRQVSAADSVIIGASLPQIAWYADRKVVDFPEGAALQLMPAGAEWAVVTNFEPGQKPYVRRLFGQLTRDGFRRGDVLLFKDHRFFTALVRTGALKQVSLRSGPGG